MHRGFAAVGSALFFLLAPGFVAGLVPYWISGWRAPVTTVEWLPMRVLGFALIVAGLVVLVSAFVRFVREGSGTPAPVAPTERLVVGGLYRYVRNPMYLAVVSVIVGQAMAFGAARLFAYAMVVWMLFAAFVQLYEEPTLERQYGAQYDAYRRAVRAWLPRLRR